MAFSRGRLGNWPCLSASVMGGTLRTSVSKVSREKGWREREDWQGQFADVTTRAHIEDKSSAPASSVSPRVRLEACGVSARTGGPRQACLLDVQNCFVTAEISSVHARHRHMHWKRLHRVESFLLHLDCLQRGVLLSGTAAE